MLDSTFPHNHMDHDRDLFRHAGLFGLLPVDLIQYLFSTWLPHATDQLTLGRSCKWLHSVVQQTEAWRLLFDPSSPLARFTQPVLGPYAPPLCPQDRKRQLRQVACLPIGRLGPVFAWVHKEQDHGLQFDDVMYAGRLVFHRQQVRPRSSPPSRPSNIYEERCRSGCNFCTDHIVGSDSLFLPLFINTDHFDAAFALLKDQLTGTIVDLESREKSKRNQQRRSPGIPHTMITSYFPQLVRNMAARLALAVDVVTVHDMEVFAQVLALWRAVMKRHALDAPSWINTKIQAYVNLLKRGGKDARQVPLMELVALLHASSDKTLTWAELAHRVVEENMIRLFEFIRACKGCIGQFTTPRRDEAAQSALWFANRVAELKTDGFGFVPWPILLFHAKCLRMTRSIPATASLDSFAPLLGTLQDGQRLMPGRLAQVLHTFLVQCIQARSGLCSSWTSILRGLGAAPMEPAAMTKWMDWCDTQVTCRNTRLKRVGSF